MTGHAPHHSAIGRHAFSAGVATSLGILVGVVLDVIIVARFGMNWHTDSYYIAVTIPLIVVTLMALQATRVVQPLLIKKRTAQSDAAGWSYLNLILTNGSIVMVGVSVVGVILSPWLVRLQATGSPGDAVALTNRLSILLFLLLPLNFHVVIMSAALQSLEAFALPGSMKFFETCSRLAFLLLFGRRCGVTALVWGSLAGAVLQLVICTVALRRRGFRFSPILHLNHPDMTEAYRLMIFPIAGQVCATAVESLTNAFGSLLGPGNVTALRLATRIIESFAGLLAGSIVTAAMPGVITAVANRDTAAMRAYLQHGVYMLLLVTIPFSIWLALTGRPLIALLYQRGSFSTANTVAVATILVLLIPNVLAGRFRSLLELPFFAEQDTRTPLLGSVAVALFSVGLSALLIRVLGVFGIPVGRSIAYVVGAWVMHSLLRRRFGRIGLVSLLIPSAKIVVASIVMGASIYVSRLASAGTGGQGFQAAVTSVALPSLVGAAVLFVCLVKLDVLTPSVTEGLPSVLSTSLKKLIALTTARYTPSGDYKVPTPIGLAVGNWLVSMAHRLPRRLRARYLNRGSYYQVYEHEELGDRQGLSIKKWQAMQMPASLDGKTVLDIGCADGFFCDLCSRLGARAVIGIDSAVGRLLRARLLALANNLNIDYRLDIFPSDHLHERFDYVLCLSVLHHSLASKDVWRVLTEKARTKDLLMLRSRLRALQQVTAPEGKCIIEIPYEYDNPQERACVDFRLFTSELLQAGFRNAQCLGTWEHNERIRAPKDRLIYVAEA